MKNNSVQLLLWEKQQNNHLDFNLFHEIFAFTGQIFVSNTSQLLNYLQTVTLLSETHVIKNSITSDTTTT